MVGVDEYATRKGRDYGTVLVDVETRRPFDLLPDRQSSSLAAWLAERPGIEVVCRDRDPFFAEGATAGAPQAVRVADRWHLWHNLSEAAERSIAQHRQCVCASWSLRRLQRPRRSPTLPRSRPVRRGRLVTGSPTEPEPSTPWWRQDTAVARSSGNSA
ncbi:transposase [Streptomyces sp. MS191]|uniref:transposase n=1 Tax=Streptomyces sp. ms191 TaxID=1827978 RepID=UPI00164F0623|nr:transposase [Streptomyces sp. ms191]